MRTVGRIVPLVLILIAPPVMLYTIWINPVSAAEDDVVYVYPMRKMVGEALRQGRWPIDNPLEAAGSPLMADPQSSVMFPPTWLFAILDAKLAYTLSVFLAFSVAGGGAYLYLRKLGLVPPAAVFGAVAFMFCGFMVGHRVHLPMIQTAAMFPWGLWCVEMLRRRPVAAFAWLVGVLFLSIVAGHWAILTYMTVAWAAYLAVRGRPVARSTALVSAAALLAAALAAPQLEATFRLLAASTRRDIGYATAGENSFLPVSAVLGLFPMLMGSQTPNFFPQRWWGAWHLSETLSYVGLSTLVLSGVAVLRLGKKHAAQGAPTDQPRPEGSGQCPSGESPLVWGLRQAGPIPPGCRGGDLRPAARDAPVRLWTWLGAGAFLWMLGYYLPTYRLIYMLPVLGVVRCPGRMLLVLEMALAALAAIGVDAVIREACDNRRAGLAQSIRRGVTFVLPAVMVAALLLVALGAWLVSLWPGRIPLPFAGGPAEVLASLRPGNPAVWVPLAVAVATMVVVRLWLARPLCAAPVLIVLLLADLFFTTRFVDVPGSMPSSAVVPVARIGSRPTETLPTQTALKMSAPDPEISPAAAWLHANAPPGQPIRVYGITKDYRDRPAELLSPRTGQGLGIGTLGSYGAWHYPPRAQAFGFDTYSRTREWPWLIRRNGLLSAYGVRYVLAAEPEARRLIESVRIADSPARAESSNLLTDRWELSNARFKGGLLRLRTPFLWWWSQARQGLVVKPGWVYRIALDARGPQGGAANYLRAEVLLNFPPEAQADSPAWPRLSDMAKGPTAKENPGEQEPLRDTGMRIEGERIAANWRHFEWTFAVPPDALPEAVFHVFTMSERAIEVRNVSLVESDWERPINTDGRLTPGQAVYRKATEVAAVRPGDPPVAIYENLLCLPPRGVRLDPRTTEDRIERLRWPADDADFSDALRCGVPDLSLSVGADPARLLRVVSLPAAGAYAMLVLLLWRLSGTRRGRLEPHAGLGRMQT